MAGSPTSVDNQPTSEFAAQAEKAGLILPVPRRTDPWLALCACAVLVVASLGIGYATGWLNPSRPFAGYSHPGRCDTPVATLGGVGPRSATPVLSSTFSELASNFTNSTGGCIALPLSWTTSDASVAALARHQTDFALAGAPLSRAENASLPSAATQVPVMLAAVAVVYDLPGAPGGLALNGSLLAGIYAGAIAQWSDPRIAQLNPGTDLTHEPPIVPFHGSGPSDVNSVFTQYLSDTNGSWRAGPGVGPNISWPVGPSADSSSGLVSRVESTPGAIGYVDESTATRAGLSVARLQNAAGRFALPNATDTTAAAANATAQPVAVDPGWLNLSLSRAPGNDSYPLAELSFAVVYSDVGLAYGGSLSGYDSWWLLTFLEWVVHAGQSEAGAAGCSPLPANLVTLDSVLLSEVAYKGYSVLAGGGSESGETGGTTGEF